MHDDMEKNINADLTTTKLFNKHSTAQSRNLTPEIRAELEDQFKTLARRNSFITTHDFIQISIEALKRKGCSKEDEKKIERQIQEADNNDDGHLELEEFINLYCRLIEPIGRKNDEQLLTFDLFRGFTKEVGGLSRRVRLHQFMFSISFQIALFLMFIAKFSLIVMTIILLMENVLDERIIHILVANEVLMYLIYIYFLIRFASSKMKVYFRRRLKTSIFVVVLLGFILKAVHIGVQNFDSGGIRDFYYYLFSFMLKEDSWIFADGPTGSSRFCNYRRILDNEWLFHHLRSREDSYCDIHNKTSEPEDNLYACCSSEANKCCERMFTFNFFAECIVFLAIFIQVIIDSPFAFRTLVSKNKQRLVDLDEEFDLDLTFITDHLIAMGVPVEDKFGSCQVIYRNPIWEVKRFLDQDKRTNTHYKIYDLCPEMPYPFDYFHDRVRMFDIQDHSPPSFKIIFEFLRDASKFRGDYVKNVIVIHCKAGKGRTGTLCCAWLLFSKQASCAKEALELFAEKRTDHIRSKKIKKRMIAVDTWGQVRCIHNLDRWLNAQNIYHGDPCGRIPKPPPEVFTKIISVTLNDLFSDDEGIGTVDLEILCPAWEKGYGKVVGESETASLNWQGPTEFLFGTPVEVKGDFRVNIYMRKAVEAEKNKKKKKKRCKAGKEPGLLFYFFQNTAFLDSSNKLKLRKHELGDTSMMKKLRYKDDGHIQLKYEQNLEDMDREDINLIDKMHLREHATDLKVIAEDFRENVQRKIAEELQKQELREKFFMKSNRSASVLEEVVTVEENPVASTYHKTASIQMPKERKSMDIEANKYEY